MFIIKKNREGKKVSETAIVAKRIKLFYEHINPSGIIFGGRILDLINSDAKDVAEAHTESACQLSSINLIRFFSLAKMGDVLICDLSVNRVWEMTLEVGVRVFGEDFRSLEKKHILSAYFTFELLDKERDIPNLICITKDQKRRFQEAEKRKRSKS